MSAFTTKTSTSTISTAMNSSSARGSVGGSSNSSSCDGMDNNEESDGIDNKGRSSSSSGTPCTTTVTTSTSSTENSRLVAQPISPFLPSPVAPFHNDGTHHHHQQQHYSSSSSLQRKKAYTAAVFYGECVLRGINPRDADDAALNMQRRYDKYWVENLNRTPKPTTSVRPQQHHHHPHHHHVSVRRGSCGSNGSNNSSSSNCDFGKNVMSLPFSRRSSDYPSSGSSSPSSTTTTTTTASVGGGTDAIVIDDDGGGGDGDGYRKTSFLFQKRIMSKTLEKETIPQHDDEANTSSSLARFESGVDTARRVGPAMVTDDGRMQERPKSNGHRGLGVGVDDSSSSSRYDARGDGNRRRTKRAKRSMHMGGGRGSENNIMMMPGTEEGQRQWEHRQRRRGGVRDVIDLVTMPPPPPMPPRTEISKGKDGYGDADDFSVGYASSSAVVSVCSSTGGNAGQSAIGEEEDGGVCLMTSEDENAQTTMSIRPRMTVDRRKSSSNTDNDDDGVENNDTTDLEIEGQGYMGIAELSIDNQKEETKGTENTISLIPKTYASDEQRQEFIENTKKDMLSHLASTGGDVTQSAFLSALHVLHAAYASTRHDARRSSPLTSQHHVGDNDLVDLDGTWLTLSRPDYRDCLGVNENGQYLYTLGRMSFDMFRPTQLHISVQGIFNTVHSLGGKDDAVPPEFIPRNLRKEVLRNHGNDGGRTLRTYNIVSAFTIEPNQNRNGEERKNVKKEDNAEQIPTQQLQEHVITRPIRGIMTNYGYALPDPNVPNRLSIWFTGGCLEVNDEERDLDEWKGIFDMESVPRRDLREYANVLAARILLGANVPDAMEDDGTMSYTLRRPIGGHGLAYCDVLYLDESLRIMKGHKGTVYVFARVPSFSDS